MAQIEAESEASPATRKQLAAVRYYLQSMIWRCEEECLKSKDGITNYVDLLNQVELWRGEGDRVSIVTFNCDRLIEHALRTVEQSIGKLSDYARLDSKYQLFKLHGSVDWGRIVEVPGAQIPVSNDGYKIAREIQNRIDEIEITRRYCMVQEAPPKSYNQHPVFPAIALPVDTKQRFECPTDHVKILEEHLEEVKRILVVGWGAEDPAFLEMLKRRLQTKPIVHVVTGGEKGAKRVQANFESKGITAVFDPFPGGFTQYTLGRKMKALFSRSS